MIRRLSPTALVLDIVGAMVLFLLTAPTSFVFYMPGYDSTVESMTPQVVMVVAGLLMCGGVAIGRLAPGIALGLAWAGAIAQMAAALPPLPIDIAILMVIYATAAWGSTRVFWAGLVSVGAGGMISAIYIAVVPMSGTGTAGLGLSTAVLLAIVTLLALGFSWVGGLLWRTVLRARQTREAQARAEETAAEEQERVRIARDMHDIVAHSLAVVIAQADGARYAAAADPQAATTALATIGTTARGALSDVRMLLTQLRHRQGDGPQPTLADLEALFAQVRQAGVEPRVTVDPMPPGEPPGAIQLAVYRILQEALTNALRHGEGAVDVRLSWWPDRVDLEIANDVASQAPSGTGGHGLIGMRERAQLTGGSLHAERDGGRFTVRATLPIGGVE
ncbi:MAG: sensor histidine kinase [Actinomycetota bacterium]